MKKNIFSILRHMFFWNVTLFLCVSCVSLNKRNVGQERDSQSHSAGNSFLAALFGEDESEQQPNNRINSNINQNGNSSTNGNLKPDTNRLPTSFQQQPQRYSRQDMMAAFSPLHLTRIEGNTWRTAANPAIVYGIIARILAQSYVISSADRRNFNVQTDWDKFFIDGRLFRNRLSVSVFPVAARQTEVVIKNSVEYYTGTLAKQEENTAWLPSPDLTDEVTKLVENTDKQTTYAYSQTMMRN